MQIHSRPSPNFGPRRGGARPSIVVIHYTAMASAEAALERLCDPAAEVSAHYLIAEDGRVWRLVEEAERAWHAGRGAWRGTDDVNSCSIGIELANPGPLAGFPPFPEPQMAALERLLDGIMARWRIGPADVIGHSDMAPGRKSDPGPKFDWRRLARGGRAVWVEGGSAAPTDWAEFACAVSAAGYRAVDGDWPGLLEPLRLRFRPWACGAALAPEDVAIARALAALGAA
ncbi:N-acetylmuramoyl-L-alanine amidase [Amaricoccus sp. B4]|uniref:N-acetylmuramoyl-L-alanine amidase n=1 Tax=Amaricoccus sp. B4 TaxID=3368557 RepID=UPI0037217E3F